MLRHILVGLIKPHHRTVLLIQSPGTSSVASCRSWFTRPLWQLLHFSLVILVLRSQAFFLFNIHSKQSHCDFSATSIMGAKTSAPSLSKAYYVSNANPWLIYNQTLQMRAMTQWNIFKCSGSTIYARIFASLSLGGLMQARQLSLRRFVA